MCLLGKKILQCFWHLEFNVMLPVGKKISEYPQVYNSALTLILDDLDSCTQMYIKTRLAIHSIYLGNLLHFEDLLHHFCFIFLNVPFVS